MSTWKRELSPKDCGRTGGWFGDLDRCWRKGGKYVAMSRQIETPIGIVEHVCIRNANNTDIPWMEKQKIKNEIFGKGRIAVEVFPAEDRLVDAANMYHLWVLPDGFEMPFGIHGDDRKGTVIIRE